MGVESIITMVILFICMLPMVIIGVVQIKSKEPVGFWSGQKTPVKESVTDVEKYNKKHGWMWIIYGIGMAVSFLIGVPFKSGVISAIAMTIEVCGGLILMILYHNYLDKKYLIK